MGEVERLCTSAARGAGLGWGMADEAGKAAVWLSGFGLPGPELLLGALRQQQVHDSARLTPGSLDGQWQADAGMLCSLLAGAALSDSATQLATQGSIQMRNVTFPLLLLPFAASAASVLHSTVCVEWAGACMFTNGHDLSMSGSSQDRLISVVDELTCRIRNMGEGKPPSMLRVQIDEHCWSALRELAQLTYAPSTEKSRLLGAGAGTDDND